MRVDAGTDFQAKVMGDTASTGTGAYAAANYMALTEGRVPPTRVDTTLLGELITATSPGLGRAQAAYAHTAGAASYTLTKTFTSSGATARTINKAAIFNAVAAGTMVFEDLVPNPPVIQNGDQVTLTLTVTL